MAHTIFNLKDVWHIIYTAATHKNIIIALYLSSYTSSAYILFINFK